MGFLFLTLYVFQRGSGALQERTISILTVKSGQIESNIEAALANILTWCSLVCGNFVLKVA